ncbi:MAG: hypothetical protein RRZ84_08940 [Romboutsia sp.]
MLETLILIVSATLSILLFNIVFYKLNLRFGLFESIRSNIDHLSKEKNKKLKTSSYILVIVIYAIITTVKMSNIIQGIFLGLLFSFRDICFKSTFLEIPSNDSQP